MQVGIFFSAIAIRTKSFLADEFGKRKFSPHQIGPTHAAA
jgi:hypothetical protein